MKKSIFIISCCLATLCGCKDAYDADFLVPETGYLVVEGFISSGNTPTTITLSRTTKISDPSSLVPENSANVFVESDANDRYPLSSIGAGSYSISTLNLNAAKKYRINITTSNGKNYVSGFTAVKSTPPIDSISWKRENDGLQLYVHAHDDQAQTKFYRWRYDETWEIRSTFLSNLTYYTYLDENDGGTKRRATYTFPDRSYDMSKLRCWQNFRLRNIMIASTEMLTRDVVYLPLAYIEPASIKLSNLYSIEVKQYALSAEAYRFYLQMKKNTEQLGTIFDPQPSEAVGNITCTNDANEVVVGYVDITQEQVLRIFLTPSQVGGWGFREICQTVDIENVSDSIAAKGGGMLPVNPLETDGRDSIILFAAAPANCVDCTLRGSNVKPSFWPN